MQKAGKILFTLLALGLLFNSCTKDTEPREATREDYIGFWQCDEFDLNQILLATFQIEIIADPSDENKVLIDNFNLQGQGFRAEATIFSTNIDIPQQWVSATAVLGSGFMANSLLRLELQYTIDDGSGQPESITAVCVKL
ncbi:MAG: hypothetical protein JKY52_13300 [Flavobacteriales bacterium]|nr:hypothetical protein [Flavobacteriales bacterium]